MNKLSVVLLFVVSAILGVSASALDAEREYVEDQGVVQEVSVGDGTVTISGLRFRVEPHADVSVRGSSSSIAALQPGMKVVFRFDLREQTGDTVAALIEPDLIFWMEQLADSAPVLEH